MSATILLTGETVSMTVWGHHQKMFVQPGVATTDLEMGILIRLCEEGNPQEVVDARFWGLACPHDLLTCWRATLIIEKIKNLEERDLCNAYYAAQRHVHSSDKHRVNEIVAKIGEDNYKAIMMLPIPEKVIGLIIKLTDEEKSVALWPISEEVEAGTLQWREDFVRIGAKHPKQVNARKSAEEIVVKRYESYLADYAKMNGYYRKCLLMWNIEGNLIEAVERGLETQGKDVVLGIAITRALNGTAAFAKFLLFESSGDEASFEKVTAENIHKAAKWLVTKFQTGFLVKKPKRSQKEYERIIRQLDSSWPSMPITNPLST